MSLTPVFRTLVLTIITSLLTVTSHASSEESPPLTWFRAESDDGAVTGWFRWGIDVEAASELAQLTVASDQPISLYVNGQRLLKNQKLTKSGNSIEAAGLEVHSLLRQGRNMVAIQVSSENSRAVFGISLLTQRNGATKPIEGGWKRALVMPPVGWQQTDFNDRDWQQAQAVADEPGDRFAVSMPATFSSPVIPAKSRLAPFRFENGDHVVFVGATFFERAQLSEHLEATLTATLGTKQVTFRNLGWDADTVFADSRGIFDSPEAGYLRMVEHIRAEEPTVAFICYGQNEAITPGMTVPQFSKQLGRFLDELAASGITCVLVSPHQLLPATPPVPSPSRFNPQIEVYAQAMSEVACSRKLLYVDLYTEFTEQLLKIDRQLTGSLQKSRSEALATLSENGVHFTDHGYRCAALILRQRLLNIPVEATGFDSTLYEQLRAIVRRKNELYFHRWRPQNITYLFGFRKHEQGNNAADIARFDPLIEELEGKIYELQIKSRP